MEKSLHKFLGIVLATVVVNTQFVVGQSADDLQARLDNPLQTRAGEVETVDLSEYEALKRERPVYVRNGKSYKFINGTLERTSTLQDSAMLVISAGSSVELADGVVLSGGKQQTGHELVLLEAGHLKLSSGKISDCYNPLMQPQIKYDNAVLLKTPDSSFEMTGGEISNTDGVQNVGGSVSLTNGSFNTGWIRTDTDFDLSGAVPIPNVALGIGAKIRITSELKNPIKLWPSPLSKLKLTPAQPDDTGDYEGVVVATGQGYTLTESDLKKLSCSKLSSSKWKFVLENNSVVIRRVGGIVDAATLQAYLDNAPAGTKDQPVRVEIPAEGIELECFVHVPANKHFLITGGSITVKDLKGGDFAFVVQDGASLTFDKIVLDGGNYEGQTYFMVRGTLRINQTVTFRNTSGYRDFYYIFDTGLANLYGGDVSGVKRGVWNEGSFNFYGGMFAECEYGIENRESGRLAITDGIIEESCTHSIYSYADFRIKGSRAMDKISIAKDCRIYMTSAMADGWGVGFIDDDFTTDVPVIVGEGYTLSETDINKVRFTLPPGYEAGFDATSSSIQVRSTGEVVVRTDKELREAIERATGTCDGEPTVITVAGEIEMTTHYIKDKSVKLTGGALKRASGYTDGLFMLDNACLTLEDIVVDGNKATLVGDRLMIWPAFSLSNQSKLTINKGTEIRNHRVYRSHSGLISIDSSDKTTCEIVMNGGSIHNNEVPAAELITDIAFKQFSFNMTGGTIKNNTTGYGVVQINTFTMSGGTIGNNTSEYSQSMHIQSGVIKSGGIIKEGKGIQVYSDLKIEGDGTNVMDSIVLYTPTSHISRNGKQKSELVLGHYAYNAGKLTAGTVVVAGYGGYQLTEDDLKQYKYRDSNWQLELSGNTIVLKESETHSFGSGDDLQDFLDGLGQSGSTGTEKEPIDVVFASAPVRISSPLSVPEGMHLRFSGATFVRDGSSLKDAPASEAMLEIPENASLSLVNTTLDGARKEVGDALVSVSGRLRIESGCVVKGGFNNGNLGAALHVASTGVLSMTGGTITGNVGRQGSAVFNEGAFVLSGGTISGNTGEIGTVVNYERGTFTMTGGTIRDNKVTEGCGGVFIGENSQAAFTGGELGSNDHSDVYSWSDVKFGGNTNVSGLFLAVVPAKLLVSSALQHRLTLGCVAETFVPETVVAQGGDGYQLTAQDLAKISCADEEWAYKLKDGNIVLVDKSTTAMDGIEMNRKIYVENGYLVLAGQKMGEPYFVYTVGGKLVHAGKITSDRDFYPLKETGLFIVKCGRDTFKVVNFSR